MPYGCANCSFCDSPIYDAHGYATYTCNVDVEEVRGKNITNEVIAMYEGATESFPYWCPLSEALEQKHGEWLEQSYCGTFWANYCSECGSYLPQGMDWKPNYCPICGAKMS